MSETATTRRLPTASLQAAPRAGGRSAVGPVRVLLADRQTLVLEALRAFLAPDHSVVGCVRDGVALVEEALRLQPETKQAAYELGITTRTVAFHKYGAMHALGIGSSAELVRFAVSTGMLESVEPARGA